MNNPLISVVMPYFNSGKYISDSVQSIVNQTLCDWELIIVDDCSSCESSKALEQFVCNPKIRIFRLKTNQGAAAARNFAIEKARGRYIAFLDSDDCWEANKLQVQISAMRECKEAFSYTAYNRVDENYVKTSSVGVPKAVSYSDMLKSNFIGCLTVVYDTHLLGKIYMPINSKREDYATWLNILKIHSKGYGINIALANYRVYSSQSSAKKMNMTVETFKLYRVNEQFSLASALFLVCRFSVRAFFRNKLPRVAVKLGWLHRPE
jgi:glycosyltransferase involved in cell wall biosynthesis